MQEKVEIITNHIVHFWTILDKNTQKRIQCIYSQNPHKPLFSTAQSAHR